MRLTSNKPAALAFALSLAMLTGLCGTAAAQMELPGAVAPTPAGTSVPSAIAKPKPRVRAAASPAPASPAPAPVPAKVPAALSLAGQTLYLNGRKSQIAFEARDNALSIARLALVGQKLSNSRDECQVAPQATPIATTDLGRPNGLVRFKLNLPSCPITFDVLDGAALAVGDPPTCDFPDADCKINADGLWGPQPASLGPPQVKSMERARAAAEKAVRADYHLLVSLTKDRPTIMGYAREQAGFTSAREEICRDYSGEGRHNFCGARLTEARVAALKAKIEVEAAARQLRKAAKKHKGPLARGR